jgi:hypothetical protein
MVSQLVHTVLLSQLVQLSTFLRTPEGGKPEVGTGLAGELGKPLVYPLRGYVRRGCAYPKEVSCPPLHVHLSCCPGSPGCPPNPPLVYPLRGYNRWRAGQAGKTFPACRTPSPVPAGRAGIEGGQCVTAFHLIHLLTHLSCTNLRLVRRWIRWV